MSFVTDGIQRGTPTRPRAVTPTAGHHSRTPATAFRTTPTAAASHAIGSSHNHAWSISSPTGAVASPPSLFGATPSSTPVGSPVYFRSMAVASCAHRGDTTPRRPASPAHANAAAMSRAYQAPRTDSPRHLQRAGTPTGRGLNTSSAIHHHNSRAVDASHTPPPLSHAMLARTGTPDGSPTGLSRTYGSLPPSGHTPLTHHRHTAGSARRHQYANPSFGGGGSQAGMLGASCTARESLDGSVCSSAGGVSYSTHESGAGAAMPPRASTPTALGATWSGGVPSRGGASTAVARSEASSSALLLDAFTRQLAAIDEPSANYSGSARHNTVARLNFDAPAASTTARPTTPRTSAGTHAAAVAAPPPPTLSAKGPVARVPAPSSASRALLSQLVARWNNNQQENQACYREGGYMAVKRGAQLQRRYVLIHKLGWGEFSTVWLAFDKQATEGRRAFVAVKIAKCGANVTESTRYEINLLRFLREAMPPTAAVTPLLDAFEHHAEFGAHQCVALPLCGSNLLCIIDYMKARRQQRREREIALVKEITASVLAALVDLEAQNVMHTDLKPENILCAEPDPKIVQHITAFLDRNADMIHNIDPRAPLSLCDPRQLVTVADFGLSVLLEPQPEQAPSGPSASRRAAAAHAVGVKKSFRVVRNGVVSNSNGVLIQTREYRAPEVLLGGDLNPRTDLWSVGCIVYELITGDFLFDPKRRVSGEREMDIEHLAMIMQVLGPVPTRIAAARMHGSSARAPRYIHRYFSEDGRFLFAEQYKHYGRRSIATELERFLEPAEAERAAQFIMCCFSYDPAERCHAADLLRHSWLRSSTANATEPTTAPSNSSTAPSSGNATASGSAHQSNASHGTHSAPGMTGSGSAMSAAGPAQQQQHRPVVMASGRGMTGYSATAAGGPATPRGTYPASRPMLSGGPVEL